MASTLQGDIAALGDGIMMDADVGEHLRDEDGVLVFEFPVTSPDDAVAKIAILVLEGARDVGGDVETTGG